MLIAVQFEDARRQPTHKAIDAVHLKHGLIRTRPALDKYIYLLESLELISQQWIGPSRQGVDTARSTVYQKKNEQRSRVRNSA